MKFQYLLTFVSLTQAAYISRMTVNRIRPTAFRPGVTLQRPWNHQRLMPAASYRAPSYVFYRNPTHRYAVKHYGPTTARNVFTSPWKTTRVPGLSPVTPEYDFVRAASSQAIMRANSGAIHTIPAPNLSLSEKPIVVVDASDSHSNGGSVIPRPTYEVTEKTPEHFYQVAKIETPVGFSKPQQIVQATPELQTLIRNGAALQVASDYGMSAISIPHSQIVPQQFTVQGANLVNFNGLPSQQDLVNSGAEGIVIPPNALYQSDPMFLQKLQSQLLQRFPAVEFIPYAAEISSQNTYQNQHNPYQSPQNHQQVQELVLLENEQVRQTDQFVPSETKNVVQRDTPEKTVVTLSPQNDQTTKSNENVIETTTSPPHNITVELIAAESQPITTTIKYVLESTEKQNTTPIYYAQIGQNIGDVIAKGFYSAINDVRAAASLEQTEKPDDARNITTTVQATIQDVQPYLVQNESNNITTEIKPLMGAPAPFTKATDTVKVTYTMGEVSERKDPVYTGQIVEASISEDHEFNKEKANLVKRAPLRLLAVSEKKDVTATSAPKMVKVVKAKIPPKSKLTFDEETGEPVLRIYASYVDSPAQKELVTTKLSSMKHKDTVDNWKSATVKAVDKTLGFDGNQVTTFGLKLRARSDVDDYVPLFEEYDE